MNNAPTYFINPAGGNGDYHLINTSPAIDAGTGDGAPNIDKDGVARPQGNGFDNGCYEFTNTSEVNEENNPQSFQLFQNYPNPFNPTTKINWQSSIEGRQTLKVYNVLGNLVATLVDEYGTAGSYEVEFDATDLSSGVYIYQLILGNYLQLKKMVLLK
jgi:hypothetical protein